MGQRFTWKLISSALLMGGIGFLAPEFEQFEQKGANAEELAEMEESKIPLRDRIDLAMKQEFEMTMDPKTGDVPRERLIAAKAYADEMRQNMRVPLSVNWVERGPDNVGGRTRAILIDPNDPTGNTLFAGSVGGGLYRCANISSTTPGWAPVNDFYSNLAVTTLAADPSNSQIIYFGTGEGYFNSDAIRGDGIWKSTDGGATFSQLAATSNATFRYVNRIAVTSTGIILAATNSGLQRSTNGGTNWTKVLGTGLGITGAGSNICYDVELASNGDVYATLDGSIHKSTNNGGTFGAAQTVPITIGRVELGAAPSDPNYLYALCENASTVSGILRTTDGGNTWTARTEPSDADGGIPATDFSRGQAWYDLSIAVDPNNRDRLFVGGVDLFGTTDGGNTWTQVSHWYGGFGFQEVHADQHIVFYQPGSSSVAYFGNDGGVFRTTNANASTPTISARNKGYNVTQFYGCAMHPGNGVEHFLAGAQDNGSQRFTNAGMNSTVEVTGGDGAFCHIDQNQSQYQFTQYVYNNYYRSTNGGSSFASVSNGNTGRFINPTDYDDLGNFMYAARSSNQYLRWDNPQTGNTFTTVTLTALGGTVSAVKVSPNTANRVFFGTGNGVVVRTDNAHTGTPTGTVITTGVPTGYISCVEVENGDDNHILISYTNYGMNSIWETTNGGTSWTSVEGNLPDMPVRWILLNPNDNAQAIIATELGVWYTDNLNGTSTVWFPGNSGLANVRTDMLQVRSSDNLVIASTHGRGLFSSDVFTSPTALFSSDRTLTYIGKGVQFFDNSYHPTSWSWNFGDGSPVSTAQNPFHLYTNPGRYNVTLTINAGASSLSKTSYIHVLPNRGTPYAPTDGGNFDVNVDDFDANNISGTNFQRGNSAVAGKNGTRSGAFVWVTGITGNYVDNSISQVWSPSFNLTAAGTYTLGFYSKFNMETSYDGFRVEYSLDKGDTWTPLGTTTAANWYNNANNIGSTVFAPNQAMFSGNVSSTFTNYFRDISFLAGNSSVAFRFAFETDEGVVSPGAAIDDFYITGPNNAAGGLPVEHSPLTGRREGGKVILDWQTYQELSNRGFYVERSLDGTHFEELGFVAGAGNSDVPRAYSFEDEEAHLGKNFYRFRQIDFDGYERFSNVVLIAVEPDEAIAIFPNPFTDHLNLHFKTVSSQPTRAELRSVDGKSLGMWNLPASGNDFRMNMPSGLASGYYYLSLDKGGIKTVHKLLRQ